MKGKKILTAGLLGILAAVTAGCGKTNEEAIVQKEGAQEEYVYVGEYRSLNQDGYYIGNVVIGENGEIFYTASSEEGAIIFTTSPEEETIKELPLELEENTQIAMGKGADDQLILGLLRYKADAAEENSIESVLLRKIDTTGNVTEEIDTGNVLLNVPDLYIQNILTDKEGNYYLCGGQSVYVLRPDGGMYFEAAAGSYISSMFSVKNEKVVICYYGNNGWQMQEIDVGGKGLKPLESAINFDYGTYQSGPDTDLLYTIGSTLYACNLSDAEPQRILDWVDSDIDSNNLKSYTRLEDGRIVAVTVDWNSEEGEAELAILTKRNRGEIPEKKVLTYGAFYLPYYVNQDIVAFNKQSEEYRIEIKQYGDDNTDYETKVSLMTADLSSGQGPDLIDMVYCPIELQELVEMGILEDLNPYLEKDSEIKREDYVENVMKAYEIDGKLYAIMPSYGVRTIIGKVSDVGENATWTMDEMIDLIDRKKGKEILSYYNNLNILNLLYTANEDVFVNRETGECHFTGDEFKKLLEVASRFPKEVDYDANGPGETEKIRSGELVLMNSIITSVALYQMYEQMFGEPINFIGYPTVGESGSQLVANGTTVAMNANSENKEGAWEFIRFNLTKERQENQKSANGGFPIMKTALEKQFEKDMEPEYYEDANGTQKEKPKSVWGSEDFSVEVFAAKPEQVERIRQMIDTAGNDRQGDTRIFKIISEEAQAYFEGQKSIEDVTSLIQDRVQIYINESR